jgi:hypothetical protein
LSISISAVELKNAHIFTHIHPSAFFTLTGISNAMQPLGRACNWDYWDYLHFSTHFFCFPLPCWITTEYPMVSTRLKPCFSVTIWNDIPPCDQRPNITFSIEKPFGNLVESQAMPERFGVSKIRNGWTAGWRK